MIPDTMLLNGKLFRASRYASGIAASEKIMVAASETQSVSFILCCTSVSFAVSNKSDRLVETNMPASGATRKSRINAAARVMMS